MGPSRAIPPWTHPEEFDMNAPNELSFSSHANALDRGLSLEAVRERAAAEHVGRAERWHGECEPAAPRPENPGAHEPAEHTLCRNERVLGA